MRKHRPDGLHVVYIRVSTGNQALSRDRQLRNVADALARDGLEMPSAELIFLDEDVSGTIPIEKRPGGARLLARLADTSLPRVTRIYVDDAARLSRQNEQFAWVDFLRACRSFGASAYLADHGVWSDDEHAEVTLPLIFKSARQFSENLSRRAGGALVELARKGFHTGGRPPFGYDRLLVSAAGEPVARFVLLDDFTLVEHDLKGGEVRRYPPTLSKDGWPRSASIPKSRDQRVLPVISMVESRVELIRRIFDLYLGGSGRAEIAKKLNEEGVPTPLGPECSRSGNGWQQDTVGKILRNPKYAGRWAYNRVSTGVFHRLGRGQGGEVIPQPVDFSTSKKMRLNPTSDQVIPIVPELAIISPEVFDAARQRGLERRPSWRGGRYNGKLDKSPFLLTSLVWCQNCGGKMAGCQEQRLADSRRYKCSTWNRSRGCIHSTVSAKKLDAYVLKLVQDWVTQVDRKALREAIRAQVKAEQKPIPKRDEADSIKAQIAELEAKRKALLANCLQPGLSAEFMQSLSSMSDDLRTKQELLRERLAEVEAARSQPAPRRTVKQRVDAILAQLDSLSDALASTDLATRKRAIRAVIKEVRVKAKRIRLPHTKRNREVVVPVEITITRVDPADGGPEQHALGAGRHLAPDGGGALTPGGAGGPGATSSDSLNPLGATPSAWSQGKRDVIFPAGSYELPRYHAARVERAPLPSLLL
ncbi:MAG: recombinase family protein [Planctomycetota bacterium]